MNRNLVIHQLLDTDDGFVWGGEFKKKIKNHIPNVTLVITRVGDESGCAKLNASVYMEAAILNELLQ